jgi:hypothetical protein
MRTPIKSTTSPAKEITVSPVKENIAVMSSYKAALLSSSILPTHTRPKFQQGRFQTKMSNDLDTSILSMQINSHNNSNQQILLVEASGASSSVFKDQNEDSNSPRYYERKKTWIQNHYKKKKFPDMFDPSLKLSSILKNGRSDVTEEVNRVKSNRDKQSNFIPVASWDLKSESLGLRLDNYKIEQPGRKENRGKPQSFDGNILVVKNQKAGSSASTYYEIISEYESGKLHRNLSVDHFKYNHQEPYMGHKEKNTDTEPRIPSLKKMSLIFANPVSPTRRVSSWTLSNAASEVNKGKKTLSSELPIVLKPKSSQSGSSTNMPGIVSRTDSIIGNTKSLQTIGKNVAQELVPQRVHSDGNIQIPALDPLRWKTKEEHNKGQFLRKEMAQQVKREIKAQSLKVFEDKVNIWKINQLEREKLKKKIKARKVCENFNWWMYDAQKSDPGPIPNADKHHFANFWEDGRLNEILSKNINDMKEDSEFSAKVLFNIIYLIIFLFFFNQK